MDTQIKVGDMVMFFEDPRHPAKVGQVIGFVEDKCDVYVQKEMAVYRVETIKCKKI